MTYPPSGSGYTGQQPTQQFSAPTQHFGKGEQPSQAQAPAQAAAAGPSKLPFYLLIGVAVLGLAVYLFSFGDLFTISDTDFPQLGSASGTSVGLGLAVIASLFAALLAGASLLPKQTIPVGVIAAVSVLGFLLVIAEIISKPAGVAIGWALYVILLLSLLQAAVAIGALLLDAGTISAPMPKPKYDNQRQQYGAYGAPGQQYYGQPGAHQGAGHQQRPAYPGQYGGYSGQPSSGGYQAIGQQGGHQSGPPTPPTGFPTYGQPQSSGSSAPTSQVPAQPQSSSSSSQSGNSPS